MLDAATSNPAFERFYADHLKKILLVRGGQRYLSKGNYNLTRFAYLLKLFPDARFIVPVRDPRWHIASLMKQHRLFCAEERRDPRILKHMQRAGHFEFGLDRRAINVGDPGRGAGDRGACGARARRCAAGRATGRCSTASCWTSASADPAASAGGMIVRYEDLCDQAEATLGRPCSPMSACHSTRTSAPRWRRG